MKEVNEKKSQDENGGNHTYVKVSRMPSTVVKATWAAVIRRVQFGSEKILVTTHGQDAVEIGPVKDLQE